MAILIIEAYGKWIKIETIPITRKTNSEILNRIPNSTKLWRAAYLNRIIKNPKMSIEQWGNIPFITISTIYDCIDDFLLEYETENKMLNSIINMIETKEFSDETIKKIIKIRDHLLENINNKEGNEKLFKYSQEKIDTIRTKSEIKKSTPFKFYEVFKNME